MWNLAITGSNSISYNPRTDATVPRGLRFRLARPLLNFLTAETSAALALKMLVFPTSAFLSARVC